MRFMVIVKASKESEGGASPDKKMMTEMGQFNEELSKAGVMLAMEGLHASSKGVRVRFGGGKKTVIDGPFSETKELIAAPSPRTERQRQPIQRRQRCDS